MTVFALIAACSEGDEIVPDEATPLAGYPFSDQNTYVAHSPNGYSVGSGTMPNGGTKFDFKLPGAFKWVVAEEGADGDSIWALVRNDGSWISFRLGDDEDLKVGSSSPLERHELLPQLAQRENGRIGLAISAVSNPVNLELAAALSAIENTPDGSTILGSDSLFYSYSGPTDRYPHGALGDKNEWTELVMGSTNPDQESIRFQLPDDEVFEGLYPLVADVNGDGKEELVTTVSESSGGARLVVFAQNSDGLRIIAESDSVGTGFRWLHQIAVAPFGPNGEIEIGVVETPHVGGIAKFYRLVGDRLELVASSAGGYMSHVNGSRNLDQAVAGDFDGDGAVELLVPSRSQEKLVALRRVGDAVEEVWELDLGSRLSTNLAVVETDEGGLILGAGTEDGALHIWQ